MKIKLLTTKGDRATSKPKAKKQFKKKTNKGNYGHIPFSLAATISSKYEGVANSLAGVINDLSSPLKTLFTNADLKKTKYSHNGLMLTLSNNFTFILKECTHANKHSVRVIIKQKNKTIHDKIHKYNEVYKRSK